MHPSEMKVFDDFPKVGTFVPNDGSTTSTGYSWLLQVTTGYYVLLYVNTFY